MLKIYLIRWNHLASYRGLPSELEDIRLLLEQRSEAEFQWTPYEDLAIRAVILEEFLQNPNAWHAKVVLINYATVEPHQTDRVLRQFGCRQLIPADPKVFDNHHKIDLRLLACVPEYMPWFKIHGKPYLLTPEERQRQIRVERERRGPLNPRRQDYEVGAKCPVQLHFLLCRADRRYLGQRCRRDRKRGRRGALLFTNHHQHMAFKHHRRS
ncbi:hypothetical protein Gotur_028010 [Gossypium turneri]